MAYVREKVKKGNVYYYIVEGRRENGRVKQVILEYIGPLEKLKQLALNGYLLSTKDSQSQATTGNGAGQPVSSDQAAGCIDYNDIIQTADLGFKCYRHGAVMAMFWTIEQLGLEQILEECFPPKTIKGLSRSRLLVLAMIQRAVEPGSKREFSNWCRNTSLPYHLKFNVEDLDSAAFWEAMDGISETEIINAWNRIIRRLIELYQLDLRLFHLDYSNYYTFINTANGRCVICKRGHNKQKRDDLLQFNLAALTTVMLNVPIAWQLYDGNVNDKTEFPVFTAFIREQLHSYGIDPAEVTITFDGGSNSKENFSGLGFHFVCAHSMASHKDLYDIGLENYKTVLLANGHERQAYFLEKIEFSGVHGSGVLVYSEDLMKGQVAQLSRDMDSIREIVKNVGERLKNPKSSLFTQLSRQEENIRNAQREAAEYNNMIDLEEKERAASGSKRRGRQKKHKDIPQWLPECEMLKIVTDVIYKKHRYFEAFSAAEVKQDGEGKYELVWKIDTEAKDAYIHKYYGKKLICTDRTDWSMIDILNQYTDQECIENGIFRTSKDVDHFAIRPQYHWTDDKIRVHVFLCLAAVTIAEVLRKHFNMYGIAMPKARLLEKLDEIHDGWLFVNEKKVKRVLEKLDTDQQELWNIVLKIKDGINVKLEKQET